MHEPDKLPEENSKSERKRQMLALQKIGEILVELPAPQLAKIPLEERLADAIHLARGLTSHEGKRRQLQYIGRLMRNVDAAPIQEALAKIQLTDQYSKAKFHQVERWRDKLIAEDDATLQDFIQKFPQADAQQLRQLIRNAKKDLKESKKTGAETALFRFLRDAIEESK
jgi:ribosome-associated protein